MARIHVRVDEDLSKRIDRFAAARATTRTRIVIELLELGLEARAGTTAIVSESLRNLTGRFEDWSETALQSAALGEQQAKDFRSALSGRIDRLMRLGVESVMILRRLAQAENPHLLAEAQAAAREFVRDQTAATTATDGAIVKEEARPP